MMGTTKLTPYNLTSLLFKFQSNDSEHKDDYFLCFCTKRGKLFEKGEGKQ